MTALTTAEQIRTALLSGNVCFKVTDSHRATSTFLWVRYAEKGKGANRPYFCRTLTSFGLDPSKGESFGTYAGTLWEDKMAISAGRRGLPQGDPRFLDAVKLVMLARGTRTMSSAFAVEQLPVPIGSPPFHRKTRRDHAPSPTPTPLPTPPAPPVPPQEPTPTGFEDDFEFEGLDEDEEVKPTERVTPKPMPVTWIDVACPHCGSQASEWCRAPNGDPRRNKPHLKRVGRARRENNRNIREAKALKEDSNAA